MIRKILKWSAKILTGTLVLVVLIYGGFHLWEYATGGKYIKYLSENSEVVPLEKNFSYETLGKDIEQNQLILVGEIHGFDEPSKFDVDFFKYLHKNHNVAHYFAEFDFVQANLLNDFLKTGDQELLKKTLRKWAVFQGRNNKDYFNKYMELHKYYKQLPEGEKFEIIGIDRFQDRTLLTEFLNKLSPNSNLDLGEALKMDSILILIDQLNLVYSQSPDTLSLLSHLKFNAQLVLDKENREEILFQNFSKMFKKHQLTDQKIYGFFGLSHVFQYRINGYHPLASKIRMSDLGLENKILSINIMMNDSHMVMASKQLPEFMRDSGPYTKMAVSADNMLFMYLVGVKDLKRMTPEHHKSLIKMTAQNSPYGNSSLRMTKAIQLLPVTDLFEMNDKGKPYVQYTVFVRNSDWAEPME